MLSPPRKRSLLLRIKGTRQEMRGWMSRRAQAHPLGVSQPRSHQRPPAKNSPKQATKFPFPKSVQEPGHRTAGGVESGRTPSEVGAGQVKPPRVCPRAPAAGQDQGDVWLRVSPRINDNYICNKYAKL